MMLYKAGPSSSAAKTEFEILRESHKFLREDGEKDAEPHTWEDKLAKKYYDTLFREYAVCDLKHYKSGNFALRWRTESEVISGAGETTCGNTRCPIHSPRNHDPEDGPLPGLKTLELPFAYVEKGENKMALVKVVLCDKCCKKLMWKRNKEKERQREAAQASGQRPLAEKEMTKDVRVAENATDTRVKQEDMPEPTLSPPRHRHHHVGEPSTRHRSDRSRSPRRRSHDEQSRRRRSP